MIFAHKSGNPLFSNAKTEKYTLAHFQENVFISLVAKENIATWEACLNNTAKSK